MLFRYEEDSAFFSFHSVNKKIFTKLNFRDTQLISELSRLFFTNALSHGTVLFGRVISAGVAEICGCY